MPVKELLKCTDSPPSGLIQNGIKSEFSKSSLELPSPDIPFEFNLSLPFVIPYKESILALGSLEPAFLGYLKSISYGFLEYWGNLKNDVPLSVEFCGNVVKSILVNSPLWSSSVASSLTILEYLFSFEYSIFGVVSSPNFLFFSWLFAVFLAKSSSVSADGISKSVSSLSSVR